VNGDLYFPSHPLAQGHPYFSEINWTLGIIYSKGKTFKKVDLKYDLDMDRIILQEKLNDGKIVKIVLNNELVDSFAFMDKKFVNTRWILNEVSIDGFVELIYSKEIKFFIKYEKEYVSQFTDSNPYGKYSKMLLDRYLYKDGILTRVSTRKAFLNYFEVHKKEIKKYLRAHQINYRKASSQQLFDLMNYCNELF
jgi:hypothetical protein